MKDDNVIRKNLIWILIPAAWLMSCNHSVPQLSYLENESAWTRSVVADPHCASESLGKYSDRVPSDLIGFNWWLIGPDLIGVGCTLASIFLKLSQGFKCEACIRSTIKYLLAPTFYFTIDRIGLLPRDL